MEKRINLFCMGKVIRRSEIRRRRARRAKIDLLRAKYAAAKTKKEKDAIMAKLAVVAPWISEQQFLTPMK